MTRASRTEQIRLALRFAGLSSEDVVRAEFCSGKVDRCHRVEIGRTRHAGDEYPGAPLALDAADEPPDGATCAERGAARLRAHHGAWRPRSIE